MKRVLILLVLFLGMQSYCQEDMLCRGYHWTEDEGNLKLKEFSSAWDDIASWEKRANRIRKGIIDGLRLDEMPEISGEFKPVIVKTKEMDGYIVENIAIESFPGFYITGNLYRPMEKQDNYPAILCPHGHWEDRRFSDEVQLRCAFLAHHMKLNHYGRPYKNGYREDFISILPKEDLKVFSDDNPRPANALKGNKAVLEHLGMD